MDSISTAILALSLIIIMLGMGLSLTIADFTRIFINPKAILTGLFCQLVALPVIGFGIISVMDLPAEIAIGLIILAACPGGPTSNLIAHLAKGDLALSVSLTAISSLVTLLSIPILINMGLNRVLGQGTLIQLNVVSTIAQIFVIVILPVGIGMWIRARKEAFADRMLEPVRKASALVFVLVLVGVIAKERANLIPFFQQAGIAALILNVLTMGFGYFIGRIMSLSIPQRISISIEGGIQNGTLAITIATAILHNSAYAITPAVYSIIMFLTSGLLVFMLGRRKVSGV
ncbi:bile acid:sodium symporter family protein [Fulvivirga lutea]|uniref:Bile acid:sodium symporter family protein n=1 Tax=Fulvivirga lutea TaxID=2810512 RepID=A0A974WPB5_9BACT|nr:bile acid:sodium symporter family protein [Fulvivirga lutea]QSE99168.1 bile acid:sodium symporter family protein [Fulvivirga lutea]